MEHSVLQPDDYQLWWVCLKEKYLLLDLNSWVITGGSDTAPTQPVMTSALFQQQELDVGSRKALWAILPTEDIS